MLYETLFLIALCRSWLIEIPVLLICVQVFWKTGRPSPARVIGTGLIATALTLPYLWFVFPPYLDMRYYPLYGELIVIGIEAALYWGFLGMRPRLAVMVSVLANAASFAVGWFLA